MATRFNKKRTRADIINDLQQLNGHPDQEQAHVEADELLLEMINDSEVTRAFKNIPKWYA